MFVPYRNLMRLFNSAHGLGKLGIFQRRVNNCLSLPLSVREVRDQFSLLML